MLQRKLREWMKRKNGDLGLATALLCLVLLTAASQGLVLAEGSSAELSQTAGVPAALDPRLADIRSLEDILKVAVANNHSVKIAEISIEEALAGGREVEAALRPQLNLAGQYVRENVANNPAVMNQYYSAVDEIRKYRPDLPAQLEVLSGDEPISTTVGSLTYYQQLAPTAQIRGFQRQADIGTDVARMAKDQAVASTIVTVQEGYFNVLRAYSGLLAALAARDHAQLNLEAVERQLELGTATPLDVLKGKTAVLEAENNLQMASTGLELAVLGLLNSMGFSSVDGETAIAWAEQLAQSRDSSIIPWEIELNEAYAYALEHKLELAMARKQLEMAESAYRVVKEERDWTLSLTGKYQPADDIVLNSSIDSNLALMITAAKSKTELPEAFDTLDDILKSGPDPWRVELSLSYRFGDGGARRAQLDAKMAAVEKARLQVKMAEDGCYLELKSCLQQLDQALRAYELALQGEQAAKETLEQLESMYELGSVTGKEVREGRLMVIQAQNRVLDAALTYEAAKAKLAVAMGIHPEALMAAVGRNQWDRLMDH